MTANDPISPEVPWAPMEADGREGFAVVMDGGYTIAEGVCNGGYVLAVLHQVALAALADAGAATTSAVAVSGQFLAPTPAGPARVAITRLRAGRHLSRVDLEIGAGGRTTVRGALSFIAPMEPPAALWSSVSPPIIAARGQCRPMPPRRTGSMIWPTMYEDRIELLVDPRTSGFLDGEPSGDGEIQAWWSLRDQRVMDAGLLLLALDAMPPATMELKGATGGSPTVQLEARLYADRATLQSLGGSFIVRQQVLTAGPVTADQACEVWDPAGRFLASATQVNWQLR